VANKTVAVHWITQTVVDHVFGSVDLSTIPPQEG